jgi:PIF1-like helicase
LNCGLRYSPGDLKQEHRDAWMPVDLFIIDELSFLDLVSLSRIESRIRAIRRRSDSDMVDSDVPFDGITICLSGDFAQLPPPGKNLPLFHAIDVLRGVAKIPAQRAHEEDDNHASSTTTGGGRK